MRREFITKSTSGGCGQFETSPEEIEQEMLTALCERRQTDRLKTNYRVDVPAIYYVAGSTSINVLLLSFQSFDVDVGLVMRTCYALCLVDLLCLMFSGSFLRSNVDPFKIRFPFIFYDHNIWFIIGDVNVCGQTFVMIATVVCNEYYLVFPVLV